MIDFSIIESAGAEVSEIISAGIIPNSKSPVYVLWYKVFVAFSDNWLLIRDNTAIRIYQRL
ncbi:hypothetical protein RINTHM_13640 [Richelia intracellularis HM01]|uniref:hypothetical protein n=1 Tax=Richelia intracellularis TaxID=1164990 RepID=UPI0002B520F4|nr:hypothetical protein [Richelia intracellularis]CCH65822.1 hypothetical protein RINTHM_13640 [Richelia intracellularis HM01]